MMSKITRTKAGIIHFCLSLTIFSVIFFVLFNLWYPEPFFTASGGWQGLKIAASIDLVLGPLLTLIVFNPSKSPRELSLDVAVIAFFQVAALVWGVMTIYQQRPVLIAFWEDGFMTVNAADLAPYHYNLDELSQLSQQKPPFVYVEQPSDAAGIKWILGKVQQDKIAPHYLTELYRPLDKSLASLAAKKLNMTEVLNKKPALKPQLDALLLKTGLTLEQIYFFPLIAKYQNLIFAFSTTGEWLGYLTPPTLTVE